MDVDLDVNKGLRIALFSKFPPIQGGESGKAFWLAKWLAEKGCKVYVFTNYLEFDLDNKTNKLDIDVPNLFVYSTYSLNKEKTIPVTDLSSERLLSLALNKLSDIDVDIVWGWYMFPYSFAAYTYALLNDKPFVIQHAGSDMFRHCTDQRVRELIERMFSYSKLTFTYHHCKEFVEKLGASEMYFLRPTISNAFNHRKNKDEFGKSVGKVYAFLGKLNRAKGIYHLIESFEQSSQNNKLIIIGNGHSFSKIETIVEESNANITLLRSVHPYEVADILEGVDAVVVPEYQFGVARHKSLIPLECLRVGVPVIISEQISYLYGELQSYFIKVLPSEIRSFSEVLDDWEEVEKKQLQINEDYDRIQELVGRFDSYAEGVYNSLQKLVSKNPEETPSNCE